MKDVGELVVGAYLKLQKDCDIVEYNARLGKGKIEGLGELDVIGFKFEEKKIYICEVTTHLLGLRYGSYDQTIKKIADKHLRQISYAKKYIKDGYIIEYMFWSPIVPSGLASKIKEMQNITFCINSDYTEKYNELKDLAGKITYDVGNPFFRILQIQEHLRSVK